MNSNDLILELLETSKNNFTKANECKNFSTEQLNWKRDSKTWSIAQVLEHLVITNEGYFKEINNKIHLLKDSTSYNYKLKNTFFASLIYYTVKPNTKMKAKTPAVMMPDSSFVSADILNKYLSLNKTIQDCLINTKNKDLNSVKIISFVNSMIKMNFWEAFLITITHDLRHIQQIDRIKKYQGLPG